MQGLGERQLHVLAMQIQARCWSSQPVKDTAEAKTSKEPVRRDAQSTGTTQEKSRQKNFKELQGQTRRREGPKTDGTMGPGSSTKTKTLRERPMTREPSLLHDNNRR